VKVARIERNEAGTGKDRNYTTSTVAVQEAHHFRAAAKRRAASSNSSMFVSARTEPVSSATLIVSNHEQSLALRYPKFDEK
jgi:hypothetical protein